MNDFDFLVATWDVTNRRRRDFLDENSPWEEFPAVSRASRHFDGAANFDEIEFPREGFPGLTPRLYDPQRQEWSLHWANKRTGKLFPPVIGSFTNGRDEFYGDDTPRASPSKSASSGATSPRTPPTGSKHSRQTVAQPG